MGSFKIIEKLSDVNYKIALTLKDKVVINTIHIQIIKPIYIYI